MTRLRELAAELREIATGPGERREKAVRAAAAIARAGGYRWVGLYDVGPAEIGVLGWAGPSAPTHPTFPRHRGLNGAAVATGEPVVVQDVSRDPRYLSTLGSTRAEMIMPVRAGAGGEVLGTIDVESDRVHPFTERDTVLLRACAEALAALGSTSGHPRAPDHLPTATGSEYRVDERREDGSLGDDEEHAYQ